MIITTFRSSCARELPQNIIKRHYKNFNGQDFLNDLETNLILEEDPSTCVLMINELRSSKKPLINMRHRKTERFVVTKLHLWQRNQVNIL